MATSNDSSCQYTCKNYQLNISTDCWGQEISWQLTKDDIIIEYVNENEYDDTTSYSYNFYLIEVVTFTIYDGYGGGMSGSSYNSCSLDGDYQLNDEYDNLVFSMDNSNFETKLLYFLFC